MIFLHVSHFSSHVSHFLARFLHLFAPLCTFLYILAIFCMFVALCLHTFTFWGHFLAFTSIESKLFQAILFRDQPGRENRRPHSDFPKRASSDPWSFPPSPTTTSDPALPDKGCELNCTCSSLPPPRCPFLFVLYFFTWFVIGESRCVLASVRTFLHRFAPFAYFCSLFHTFFYILDMFCMFVAHCLHMFTLFGHFLAFTSIESKLFQAISFRDQPGGENRRPHSDFPKRASFDPWFVPASPTTTSDPALPDKGCGLNCTCSSLPPPVPFLVCPLFFSLGLLLGGADVLWRVSKQVPKQGPKCVE